MVGPLLNFDNLTYSGNLNNLSLLEEDARHIFVKGDICDTAQVNELFSAHRPRAVINFAAESPVDR